MQSMHCRQLSLHISKLHAITHQSWHSMAVFLVKRLVGVLRSTSPSLRQASTLVSLVDNSTVLDTKGSQPLSASFQANAQQMGTLIHNLNEKIAQTSQGGGQKAADRNRSRGKLLPRERIHALLDPGSPFLELSQLAGFGLYGALNGSMCHLRASLCSQATHGVPVRPFIFAVDLRPFLAPSSKQDGQCPGASYPSEMFIPSEKRIL